MKIGYLMAIALPLLHALPTQAQGPVIGVKGGLNYSTLAVDKADDEKGRIGFNVGLMGRTDPEAAIGLQVELLYTTKGAHADYSALFGLIDQEVDFNLNYVELPVMASFRLAEVFELQAGAYAAVLTSAKAKSSGDLGDYGDDLKKSNFRNVDYGLVGGIAFNAGPAQVGLRYEHGLAKVAESSGAKAFLGKATNRNVQAYVAFGF